MSNQISKKKTILIIVLAVTLLIGICFATLSIYAKKTLNAPKFKAPEDKPLASATELPESKEELSAYVNSLYEKALKADDAEGSWHTDVNLEGDIVTPFAPADNALAAYIKDNAAVEIAGLYPNESEVLMSEAENAPRVMINPADITEFTAECGHTDENGNVSDDGFYFITFELTPESIDTAAIPSGEVYKEAVKKFEGVADIKESEFEAEAYSVSFKIDRVTDQILNVDVYSNYRIKASAVLDPAFTELLPLEQDSLTANIELPYKTAQRISFKWYGARFTQRSMTVKPNDMKALPADVEVNSAATKEDYKLTFTPSDKEAVSIDADGVMTVAKNAAELISSPEETVTIKMVLEYAGHTYEDELTIYITELEVESDE